MYDFRSDSMFWYLKQKAGKGGIRATFKVNGGILSVVMY